IRPNTCSLTYANCPSKSAGRSASGRERACFDSTAPRIVPWSSIATFASFAPVERSSSTRAWPELRAVTFGDLKSEIRQLEPWFHNLHLPGGVQTCPDHVLG